MKIIKEKCGKKKYPDLGEGDKLQLSEGRRNPQDLKSPGGKHEKNQLDPARGERTEEGDKLGRGVPVEISSPQEHHIGEKLEERLAKAGRWEFKARKGSKKKKNPGDPTAGTEPSGRNGQSWRRRKKSSKTGTTGVSFIRRGDFEHYADVKENGMEETNQVSLGERAKSLQKKEGSAHWEGCS